MTEYHPSILADGTLGTTSGAPAVLYTGVADTVLQSLRVFNDSGAQRTVTFVAKRSSGTPVKLARVVLEDQESAVLSNLPIGVDDMVGAYASGGNVNYFVFGARR